MKRKYLLLIIPFLILCLFAGCKNKPVESKQQEKNEESIKVKIFMTPCTEYLGHEEVKPKETEVKEPFVKLYDELLYNENLDWAFWWLLLYGNGAIIEISLGNRHLSYEDLDEKFSLLKCLLPRDISSLSCA